MRSAGHEQGDLMEEIGKNESIRVSIDDDGAVIAEGDIDLAGGPLLDTAILRLEGSEPVVIDLEAVEFIDSSGLRSLLAASRRARRARHHRRPAQPVSAGVMRLLTITGTTEQFQIEAPTNETAESTPVGNDDHAAPPVRSR